MVKIPSKTSAKYLEKKFNKSEKYISYVIRGPKRVGKQATRGQSGSSGGGK